MYICIWYMFVDYLYEFFILIVNSLNGLHCVSLVVPLLHSYLRIYKKYSLLCALNCVKNEQT